MIEKDNTAIIYHENSMNIYLCKHEAISLQIFGI